MRYWLFKLGYGQCINGSCACDSPWTPRADYLFAPNSGCLTHGTARLGLLWVTWLLSIITLAILTYAFWRLAPFYLRLRGRKSARTKAHVSAERRGGAQIMVLIMVALSLGTLGRFSYFCPDLNCSNVACLACSTICLFGGVYIRENTAATIIFILFAAGQLGMSIYHCHTWIRLAAAVASDMEFKRRLASIRLKIDVLLIVQTVVLGSLMAVCALGVHISQDINIQLGRSIIVIIIDIPTDGERL